MALTDKVYNEFELLSRHIKVLQIVMEKQPIGIVRISQELGVGEHEVRHSLGVLEEMGFVKPTPNGAIIKGNIKDGVIKAAEVLDDISQTAKVLKKELLRLVM
jgi:predicted transcriptional regulator